MIDGKLTLVIPIVSISFMIFRATIFKNLQHLMFLSSEEKDDPEARVIRRQRKVKIQDPIELTQEQL